MKQIKVTEHQYARKDFSNDNVAGVWGLMLMILFLYVAFSLILNYGPKLLHKGVKTNSLKPHHIPSH